MILKWGITVVYALWICSVNCWVAVVSWNATHIMICRWHWTISTFCYQMPLEIAVVYCRTIINVTTNAAKHYLSIHRTLWRLDHSRHIAVADFRLDVFVTNKSGYGSHISISFDVAVNQGKVLHRAIHISEELVAQAYDGMAVAVKMSLERLIIVKTYAVVHNSGHIDVSTQSEILVLQVISSIYVRFQCR